MKFILKNSGRVKFQSKEDLNKVIPDKLTGKALNYGQGEGQVKIENTVWGFYVNSDNEYYMAYEEGVVSWEILSDTISDIVKKINKEFEVKINIIVEGPYTNRNDV